MRKTNTLMLNGTGVLVLGMLALTATTTSNAAIDPAEIMPVNIVKELSAATLKSVHKSQQVEAKTDIVKLAANEAEVSQPKMVNTAGFKPMRLRMTPHYWTQERIDKVIQYRQSVAEKQGSTVKGLEADARYLMRGNHFQVNISDNGHGSLDLSKGQGGWPDQPKSNTDWLRRPVSANMQNGLRPIIQRCAAASDPVYFIAELEDSDADISKGGFEVECVPGSTATRARLTSIDLAKAYLNSSGLPLDQRRDYFQWKMPFAMFAHYVSTTPNATIAKDRAECVRIYTLMKRDYAFTSRHQDRADDRLGKCATSDYNWVRKRENIPTVQ